MLIAGTVVTATLLRESDLASVGNVSPSPSATPWVADKTTSYTDLAGAAIGPDGKPRVLVASDATAAQDLAASEQRPVEVLDRRLAAQTVFALPDGTWNTEVWSSPKWVAEPSASGETQWARADSRLQVATDGSIRPIADAAHLVFSPGGRAEGVILRGEIPHTGVTFSVTWDGSFLPAAVIDGARITYPDVRPGVDYVIEVLPTGYQQYFIVANAAGAASVSSIPVNVVVTGGTIKSGADSSYRIVDGSGVAVATSPEPQAWDYISDLKRANPVTVPWSDSPRADAGPAAIATVADAARRAALQKAWDADANPGEAVTFPAGSPPSVDAKGTRAHVGVEVPAALLDNPTTVYPVVVDPAPSWSIPFDAFVETGWTSDQSGSTELKAGSVMSGSTNYVARAYFSMSLANLEGADILASSLYLYVFHAAACSSSHPFVLVRSGYVDSSVRWTNQPSLQSGYMAIAAGYAGDLCGGSAWVSMDTTALMQQFSREPAATQSFMLAANNEADVADWRRFNSGNASSNQPYFSVTYNSPPTVGAVTVDTQSLAANVVSINPNPPLSAVVTDPDGGNVRAYFTVKQGGYVVVDSLEGSQVASGSASTATMPYALAPGVTYTVEVRGSDGRIFGSSTIPAGTFSAPASTPREIPNTSDGQTGVAS
jgi:hypothetical protein